MSTYCDLHTHSIFSDGTFTPEEIIKEAERIGLSAVALCDHNTAEGLPAFLQAGESSPVTAVPGVELSTDYGETELHIVGLFLPEERLSEVHSYTEALLNKKAESNRELISRLQKDGYDITFEEVASLTPKGRFNRSHIGAKLTEKGYVSSVKEAFATLLAKESPYYVPVKRIPSLEAIAFLKSIGAVPVLAHPLLDLGREELKEFLPQAVEAGLAAVEVLHPAHSKEEAAFVSALIEKYNLLSSGGSDFHGTRKPDVTLGMKNVPHTYFESLLNCSTHRV
jgi:predicted metal-dependent phosphoesterase TrpH